MRRLSELSFLVAAVTALAGACSEPRLPTSPAVGGRVADEIADDGVLGEASPDDPAADVPSPARGFTVFQFPASTATIALGIDAAGDVVGRYVIAGATHGFLRTADGTMTSVDYPGAAFTVAANINDSGDIVGMYALPGALTERHGYLRHDGIYTTLDPAGSRFTNVLGIDETGRIVGRYCTTPTRCGKDAPNHAFLLVDGVFTTIDVPGSTESDGWQINPRGTIFGGFIDASGTGRLFLRQGDDLVTFDLPGAPATNMDKGGINARGDIVGVYCDAAPCVVGPTGVHGYLLRDGGLTTIDYPASRGTAAFGINPRGDIVGAYFDATSHAHGFILSTAGRGH